MENVGEIPLCVTFQVISSGDNNPLIILALFMPLLTAYQYIVIIISHNIITCIILKKNKNIY